MTQKQNSEEIRQVLKVPKSQRIGQYIYNMFRDYEGSIDFFIKQNDKKLEGMHRGIDIFNVTDREFIKRIEEGLGMDYLTPTIEECKACPRAPHEDSTCKCPCHTSKPINLKEIGDKLAKDYPYDAPIVRKICGLEPTSKPIENNEIVEGE